MAHDTYHMLINRALDGDLEEADHIQLEQHVQECTFCADLWGRMQVVETILTRPIEIEPPLDLAAKVMARIETYELRRRWTPWFVGLLAGSSLLAAVSLALPIILLTLGLDGIVAASPVAGRVLLDLIELAMSALDGAVLAANLLTGWLTFILNEPFALGTVLAALVLASTWIGILESAKVTGSVPQTVTS